MPARPASPVTVLLLAAVGALVAGAAGVGAYLGVDLYLANRPVSPGGQGTDPVNSASPEPTFSLQTPCPDRTIEAVGQGSLVIVVYARGPRVAGDRLSLQGEAWICQDSEGRLYYQGHDLTGPPGNNNTVLVGEGVDGEVALEGSTYVATRSSGGTYWLNCAEGDLRTSGNTIWQVECTVGDGPSTFASDVTG